MRRFAGRTVTALVALCTSSGIATAADVAAANFTSARWERSPFPANLMMSRHTPTGRVTLFNRDGRRIAGSDATPFRLESEAALARTLAEDFGLALPPAVVARVWERIAQAPARAA